MGISKISTFGSTVGVCAGLMVAAGLAVAQQSPVDQPQAPVITQPLDTPPAVEETPKAVTDEPDADQDLPFVDGLLMPFGLEQAAPSAPPTVTVVRALDKITARTTQLELPQDAVVRFGTLSITARTCRSRPPEEPPETFAFLEIDDVKHDGSADRVFTGWMVASSPGLNALEHPVYDVWVLNCRIVADATSSGKE